jgi:hypothetical protein
VRGFNLFAVLRLAHDVGELSAAAARCPVAGLAQDLAEPLQLCALLLAGNVGAGVLGCRGYAWKEPCTAVSLGPSLQPLHAGGVGGRRGFGLGPCQGSDPNGPY